VCVEEGSVGVRAGPISASFFRHEESSHHACLKKRSRKSASALHMQHDASQVGIAGTRISSSTPYRTIVSDSMLSVLWRDMDANETFQCFWFAKILKHSKLSKCSNNSISSISPRPPSNFFLQSHEIQACLANQQPHLKVKISLRCLFSWMRSKISRVPSLSPVLPRTIPDIWPHSVSYLVVGINKPLSSHVVLLGMWDK